MGKSASDDSEFILNERNKTAEKEFFDQTFETNARARVRRFYSTGQACTNAYEDYLFKYGAGKRVLEYGCGLGSHAYKLAEIGAKVTGVDISEVAILKAAEAAQERNLEIEFIRRDAEAMDFQDDSFDVVCGKSILHHLNLKPAFAEIVRVLKPDGRAVFVEPLGLNPAINLFRKLTPKLRTEDERPLHPSDFKLAENYFKGVELTFFQLTSPLAAIFSNTPLLKPVVNTLDTLDAFLFRMIPGLKWWAWKIIVKLEEPKK